MELSLSCRRQKARGAHFVDKASKDPELTKGIDLIILVENDVFLYYFTSLDGMMIRLCRLTD